MSVGIPRLRFSDVVSVDSRDIAALLGIVVEVVILLTADRQSGILTMWSISVNQITVAV